MCDTALIVARGANSHNLAYVLEMTIKPGLKEAQDVSVAQHRKRVWIDQQFYTLLGEQAWDAHDNLVWDTRVEQITINPPLDAALFTFTPPRGAVVIDARPADAAERAVAWDMLAQQFAFPLFAPGDNPDWGTPGRPYYDRAQGIISQAFVLRAERGDVSPSLVLLQGPPAAPALAEAGRGRVARCNSRSGRTRAVCITKMG